MVYRDHCTAISWERYCKTDRSAYPRLRSRGLRSLEKMHSLCCIGEKHEQACVYTGRVGSPVNFPPRPKGSNLGTRCVRETSSTLCTAAADDTLLGTEKVRIVVSPTHRCLPALQQARSSTADFSRVSTARTSRQLRASSSYVDQHQRVDEQH